MSDKKNILLITPGFFAEDIHIEASPVVNYFAYEWVKEGYKVLAIHVPTKFPDFMRILARPFLGMLESKLSVTINPEPIKERKYIDNGIEVYRIPMKKSIPHTRFKKSIIKQTSDKIVTYCEEKEFNPDVIVCHFVNPCVEIIEHLKKVYNVSASVVLHSNGEEFESLYKEKARYYVDLVDIFGYRCNAIKRAFEEKYGVHRRWFMCFSGIPSSYLEDNITKKVFADRYIYVGNFRARKYADAIVDAIGKVYNTDDRFSLKFIGSGSGEAAIKEKRDVFGFDSRQIDLLGTKSRDEVKNEMKQSDVFIMISRDEVFGLVYLEAMAVGCIPIASRNEGFDGIIVNRENGFLCTAGDASELARIIEEIREMGTSERQRIAHNALETAKGMTDAAVAKKYIESVLN